MRKLIPAAVALLMLLSAASALAAGFTETLPKGTWIIDFSYSQSWLKNRWDDNGDKAPLVDRIERYEPGGGLQGILIPNVDVVYQIFLTQVQYGILDELTVAIGIPVILSSTVNPRFDWISGDYQMFLGRAYSQQDFWDWAASMGQPKPGRWVGNEGDISDIVLGARWRFTDRIPKAKDTGWAGALFISGAIPTGEAPYAEEILATGSTSWDLNAQGELNFHLSVDKAFKKEADDRITLGLDLFYEVFFPHTFKTPEGKVHPLLLNFAPYVGATYKMDAGDFLGFSIQADVTPVKGPARASWISGNDKAKAESFPPLLQLSFRYTFSWVFQSDWMSDSQVWDWEREKLWRPGYKNILTFKVTFSFLRLGAPLQLYCAYRSLSLIPGKNVRMADVVTAGFQIPLKFW
jgi:hypothetical protein